MRYAITDLRTIPPASLLDAQETRRLRLLEDVRRWVAEGLDFLQLREKHLEAGELFRLAESGSRVLRQLGRTRPQLLVNSRPDIAAAARADGVHLTSRPGELHPLQVRAVFQAAALPHCTVSVSCHTLQEVMAARNDGADLILFGPVFEKRVGPEFALEGTGLSLLEDACRAAGQIPVLALGGVTPSNLPACKRAGCAGIAGIRLFAQSS